MGKKSELRHSKPTPAWNVFFVCLPTFLSIGTLLCRSVLLLDFLNVFVDQTGDTHFRPAFCAEIFSFLLCHTFFLILCNLINLIAI